LKKYNRHSHLGCACLFKIFRNPQNLKTNKEKDMTAIPNSKLAAFIKQISDAIRQFIVHIGADSVIEGFRDGALEHTKKWVGDKFKPEDRFEAVGLILSLYQLRMPNGLLLPAPVAKQEIKKLLRWLRVTMNQASTLTGLSENAAITALGQFWNAINNDRVKADAYIVAALSAGGISRERLVELDRLQKQLNENKRYRKLINEQKMLWFLHTMASELTRREFLQVLEHLHNDPFKQIADECAEKVRAGYRKAKPTLSRWGRLGVVGGLVLSGISLVVLLATLATALMATFVGLNSGNDMDMLALGILAIIGGITFATFVAPLVLIASATGYLTRLTPVVKGYAARIALFGVGACGLMVYIMLADLHKTPGLIALTIAAGLLLGFALFSKAMGKKQWVATTVATIILLTTPVFANADRLEPIFRLSAIGTANNVAQEAKSEEGSVESITLVIRKGQFSLPVNTSSAEGFTWWVEEADVPVTFRINGSKVVNQKARSDPEFEWYHGNNHASTYEWRLPDESPLDVAHVRYRLKPLGS